MPTIASVSVDVKLNLDSAKRQITDFGHSGGRIAGGKFEQGFSQHMKGAQGRMSSVTTGIFTGIAAGLTGVVASAAAQAASSITDLGASIVKAGATAEKSRVSFTTFLGSATKADAVLRDITKFAAETPFELPEVEKAARQLLAFGFNAEQLKPTLKAIGDVAAGTGTDFGELAEIIGKAKTQGRLFGEDINQLTGRGIPIVAELAKQFGVTEGEVKKLVEEGKIGFPELEKAFISMTSKGGRFEGLMSKLAATTGGKFTNLSDRITQSFVKIFESIQPAINAALDVAASFFDGIQVDFKSINDLAKTFAGWLIEHKDEAKAVGAAIGTFITNSFKTVNQLVQDFNNYLKENPAVLKAIGVVVDLIGKGFNVWGDALNNVVFLVKQAADWFSKIVNFIDIAATKFKELVASGKEWLRLSAQNLGLGGESAVGGDSLTFPIRGGSATSRLAGGGGAYGASRPGGRIHLAQDYSYPTGTPVVAPFSGKIRSVFTDRGEYMLVLDGKLGGRSVTANLVHLSTTDVSQNAVVAAGQRLGTVGGDRGSWGSSGAHLDYSVEVDGKRISPQEFYKRYGGGGQGGLGEKPGTAVVGNGLQKFIDGVRQKRAFDEARNANSAAGYQNWLGGIRQQNNFMSGYQSAAQANYRSPYDAINQSVEASQKRIDGYRRLNDLLQQNYEKTHQLEIQIRDGIGGAFTDAISSLLSGTRSLGDVALDLLGNLASKLLDLGLNSILGSASGGTGIFGSLLGGLFGGGRKSFGLGASSLLLPKFALGGTMQHDGLAYLHAGEKVLTSGQQQGTGVNTTVNVYNYGDSPNMTRDQADRFQRGMDERIKNVVTSQLIRHKRTGSL